MGYAVLFIWLFAITCNKTTRLTWHVLEKTLLSIQYALYTHVRKWENHFSERRKQEMQAETIKTKKRSPENRIVCSMLSKNVISTVAEAVSGV